MKTLIAQLHVRCGMLMNTAINGDVTSGLLSGLQCCVELQWE